MASKPLTPEMVRILRAARDGRLGFDAQRRRWYIDDELGPFPAELSALVPRFVVVFDGGPALSAYGREALQDIEAQEGS
jgi:hypothetical protein